MRIQDLLRTTAPAATVFVRFIVGWVFLSEGIQKFLLPEMLGSGRFARIGIPAPEIMGPFVGGVEIVCGGLLILGLLTRLAAIPLLINISVAILSTKVPILLGHGYWIFSLAKLPRYGFWSMMSEARHRFLHVDGVGVSADRRSGKLIARRADGSANDDWKCPRPLTGRRASVEHRSDRG